MADGEEIEYSEEEQAQIQELLQELDQDPFGDTFSPMAEIFRADMRELAPPPPEEEDFSYEPPHEAAPGSDEDALGDLAPGHEQGGDGLDDLSDLEGLDDSAPAAADGDDIFSEGGGLTDDLGAETADDAGTDDFSGFGDDAGTGGADFDFGDTAAAGDELPTETPADFGQDLGTDLGGDELGAVDDSGLGDLLGGDDAGPTEMPDAGDDFGLGDLEGLGGDTGAAAGGDLDLGADDGLGDLEADLGGSMDLDETPATADDLGGLGDLGGDATDAGGDLDFDLGGDAGAPAASDDLGDLGADLGGGAGDDLGADFGSDLGGDLGADLGGGDLGDDLGADLGGGDLGDDLGADLGGDFGGGDLGADLGGDLGAAPGADLGDDAGGAFAAEGGGIAEGGDFEDFSATDDFDLGDVGGGGGAGAGSLDGGFGEGGGGLDLSDDLSDMAEQAKLQSGIGDEFTDEELANIRAAIMDYPPALKKSIIDVIVNEKVSAPDQRLLMNMVADQAEADTIADFLEGRLGYRADLTPSDVRKDGVRIIYAEGLSPEDLAAKRRRSKIIAIGGGLGLAAILLMGLSFFLYRKFDIEGKYDAGLEQLYLARKAGPEQREQHRQAAERYFQEARAAAGGNYNLEYLNRYGIAYMKAGYPEDAFVKLYGKVQPDYGSRVADSAWNVAGRRAPLIRPAPGSRWPAPENYRNAPPRLTDRDNVERTVEIPGAYIVSRLRDGELDHRTLINLGRFHSQNSRRFVESDEGRKFKNDMLGIDYYRLILTLMNLPDDKDAIAGIGKVYYDRGEYGGAAREYNRILDKFPTEVAGHAGLLNTYIEIWKKEKDPRLVIARHRLARKLGLEDELPIYLLAKLAGFYIDLDPDDLRIKYQVDPVDAVSSLNLRDNAIHLLTEIFNRTEERDGETIVGSRYGEGFYQRGRFLMAEKKPIQALRQFQNAYKFDPRHYLAINQMGEYYKDLRDYDKAIQYFDEARRTYEKYYRDFGSRPEDETLVEGDYGKIFYNMGSLVFLRYAGVPADAEQGFPDTRIYPDRGTNMEDESRRRRRQQLNEARVFFDRALSEGVKDDLARVEIKYWSGWIDYTAANFEDSLARWETIDTEYAYSDPVLLMAMGNAYYYTDQIRSALGNYLKLQSDFESRAASLANPNPDDAKHREIFQTLAAAYNNLGAVYEKEFYELAGQGAPPATLRDLEQKAMRNYWAAIEASRKIGEDNEIARTNNQLAFKYLKTGGTAGGNGREPLLDDWVSPLLMKTREQQHALSGR